MFKNIDTQLMLLRLIVCISFITSVMYGMDESHMHNKKLFAAINKLPKELQRTIDQLMIHDAIHFLGLQPIIFKQDKQVLSVAMSRKLLVMGLEGCAKVCDIQTGDLVYTLDHISDDNLVWSVAIQGNNIFTGCADGMARMWDIQNGALLRTFEGHAKSIYSLAVYNDVLVTGSSDRTVRVWDIRDGTVQYIFDGYNGAILSVAINDENIVSGSADKIARIWDIYNGSLLYLLKEHISGVASVVLNNGKLITGSEDGIVKIWNVYNGDLLFTCNDGHDIEVNSIIISGDMVVVGLDDGIVKIWDIQSGIQLRSFQAHDGWVWSVVVHDGNLITGSQDCTAKIWPLFLDIQGKLNDNPLAWISAMPEQDDALRMLQTNFIESAYQATIHKQDFIIDLPKKLGEIKENESQAQKDGRIYFTLPIHVRKYLREHLNIRKK